MLRVYTYVDARNARKNKKQLVVLERRSNSRQNNTRHEHNTSTTSPIKMPIIIATTNRSVSN